MCSMMSSNNRRRRNYFSVGYLTYQSNFLSQILQPRRGKCYCYYQYSDSDNNEEESKKTSDSSYCIASCRRKCTGYSSNNWWFILVAVLFTLIGVTNLQGVNGNLYTPQTNTIVRNGLCPSKYIRNWASDLERLRGCRVIEGNLQISLIDSARPENYLNYSFPDLREVTGYVLLAYASGIQSLRHIFPNLAVIRGQDLIYNYALLISEMPDMQEVGLPGLTNILSHGAWIFNNPNLCYVDTVDWTRITNDSAVNTLQKNKPSDQCPNLCPNSCPKSDTDMRKLCWSNEDCQKVSSLTCPLKCGGRPCTTTGECCNEQCLGGCTGPTPKDCFVCKKVEHEIQDENLPRGFERVCMSACPDSTYEYLSRRCVTVEECRNLTSSDPKKRDLHGKILTDQKICVLECPKNYAPAIDDEGHEVCARCEGACKKDCHGVFVESVESSAALKGCTRITGSLKIQIRGYSPNLVRELEHNLDMIEEIEDSLVVANSHSLFSLNFLKSLKMIRGKKLEEDRYALVVKSNENIQELWNATRNNRTVKIGNKAARVLFHYNPKLCPNKIWEFVHNSGIRTANDSKMDVGSTNGDKVPCNQEKLNVQIISKDNTSVTIRWSNFRRNLKEISHLLNYEVYYKEAPTKDLSLYEDRDPCGFDDWKVIDVPKLDHTGGINTEPEYEHPRLIPGLKYYTQYALYVKTVVIPDETSPNNNTGAQSDIIYFTSLPGVPTQPTELSLASNSSSGITISWYPPEHPNGIIEKYQVYMKEEKEDAKFQDQRDYCKGRPEHVKGSGNGGPSVVQEPATTAMPSFMQAITQGGIECCSCSPTEKKMDKSSAAALALLEKEVQDAIMNVVFIPDPNFKEDFDNEIPSSEIASQENGRRRRKRRDLRNDSIANDGREDSSSESSGYKAFPDHLPQRDPAGIMPTYGELVEEITVNESSPNAHTKNIFYLGNLKHFSRYTIGIVACRKDNESSSKSNDTRVCSEMVKETTTTLPSYSADMIDVRSVSINVTGSEVKVSWEEPTQPNGIAMSYRINITRVDSAKTDQAPVLKCITRKKFNESGRNYTLPDKLLPGNYSLRIQVISLAPFEANYTESRYFIIVATDIGMSIGQILAVVIPIIIVFIMGFGFVIYCIRTKKLVKKIISANPEYLQNVDIPDEFEISRDKVQLLSELGSLKELGQGSFGMVYEGLIRDFKGQSKIRCAVKTLAKDASSEDRYRFLKEAQIMTQLNCNHVVKLLCVVSISQPTYVIMELMALGDLKKYLRSRRPDGDYGNSEPPPPPTLKQILQMAASIADGMAYLERSSMIHRDLAARNCMVADEVTVKVGDFGMTKDVVETDYYRKSTRGLLPVRWMAPESIRDGIFTSHSDVWSFGVVLWEMATLAAHPYKGLSNEQVLRYVGEGQVMERPENCPDILYDMMSRCWQICPRDRPTFLDIVEWLLPHVDSKFTELSFYHSDIGVEYRANIQAAPVQEEEQITVRTPLRATFDDDTLTDDDEDHHLVKSSFTDSDRHSNHNHFSLDLGNRENSNNRAGSYRSTNLYPDDTAVCSSSPGMDQQPLLSSSYNNSHQPSIIGSPSSNLFKNNNNNRSTNSTSDFISLDINRLNNSPSNNNNVNVRQDRSGSIGAVSTRSNSSSPQHRNSNASSSSSRMNNMNNFGTSSNSNSSNRPPPVTSSSVNNSPFYNPKAPEIVSSPTHHQLEPELSIAYTPSNKSSSTNKLSGGGGIDGTTTNHKLNGIIEPTSGLTHRFNSSPINNKPLTNGYITKKHNSSPPTSASSSLDNYRTKTTQF